MKKINDSLKEEALDFETDRSLLGAQRAILKERDRNKILKQNNDFLIREIAKIESKLGEYHAIDLSRHRPSKITPSSKSGKSESTVIACASDWHVGERIDIESVNGVNEFNPDIAKVRAYNFFKKSLTMTSIFRGSTKIDNLVLWLGGDFISGYIHEELLESNYMSPSEEVEFSYSLIVSGIDFSLSDGDFKNITIPCNVGNHGRTTIKSRVSTAWDNSFESMLYKSLVRKYDKEKRIQFSIVKSYHNIQDIYGRIIRFHHGDYERPSQGLLVLEKDHGITSFNPLYV